MSFTTNVFTIASFLTCAAASADAQQKSSPRDLVNALHTAFGERHVRAVHAKGIILEGKFTPAASAATITKAVHLQKEWSRVLVRFSDFTGIPDIPDNAGPANPRGMAIKFTMKDGTTTDLVTHSFNGFPTENSDQFRELLLAIAASGADAAKPTKLDQFLGTHPVAKTFLTTQYTPVSYSSISYFGVNAFKFTNAKGEEHFIRYQLIPEGGEAFLSPEQIGKKDANFLIDEIGKHVAVKPVRFKMYAQIAEKGDAIDNPSIAWSASRKRVLLGVLEIDKLSSNTAEEDKKLFFIPNNVPAGITAADPMINFRSNAYPISVKERQ